MHVQDGRVVSNFIVQALRGEPVTIYGDGSQTRSFCFVDDLVEGMMRMMDNEAGFIGPVNLGNPEEFSIRQLAEAVIRLTGSHAGLDFQPLPEDDPVRRRPDITLAEDQLGWIPLTPLEKGLPPTIAYFRDLLSGDGGAR